MKLYKLGKRGVVLVWEIEVLKNGYRTISGQVNGAGRVSEWTFCTSKNVGQSNQTTPEQQALLEADAKILLKREEGYVDDPSLFDTVKWKSPMLAHDYDKHKHKIKFPVLSQPKLDGIRCVATKDGLFTRNGKKIVSCPHVEEVVRDLVQEYTLDGELYNHSLRDDFNQIVSLVKKQKPSPEDLDKSRELIQYWIFDFYSPLPALDRSREIIERFGRKHTVGLISDICTDKDQLDNLFKEYQVRGYEGQMVRSLEAPYRHERTTDLLKRKVMQTEEFLILDVLEGKGNRSGMAGSILLQSSEGTFNSSIVGSFSYCKQLLQNKPIGKKATIRFQNLTPDGIPRFPEMIAVRDYE